MNMLLSLCLAMVAGLVLTRLMKLVQLPNVTGYLIAGLLIGPFCLKWVSGANLESFSTITALALGFIAFSIGGEFKLENIKRIGSRAITITLFQALCATAFVDIALLVAKFPAPIAITLGAIATATAPAATLMVIRQYKAKGIVTQTLLPVVALDDAVGLMVYAISAALAKSMSMGTAMTIKTALVEPMTEIILSLLVGSGIGVLLSLSMRWFQSKANRTCLIITAVLGAVALSQIWSLSSLLVCMMVGATLANIAKNPEPLMELTDRWTPPIFMLFFVISGAELNIAIIPSVGLLGILYLIFRSLGKYFGSYLGAKITHADPAVRKYLGITLLPQAGVAIGMAQMTMGILPQAEATQISAVVLCATLVYELFGPVLTKIALKKAGEIQ
ncbi:MAG: cation:proton antiporter [Clostridia bacterium]|nr:cation:proton antiporter [Clostridia bacterium]